MGKPVYSGGKVHVMREKCSTCIFRPGNPMHLAPGRVKEMVEGSVEDGAGITCHQTLPYHHKPVEQQATCRGFFDAYGDRVLTFSLAKALDMIEEV